jgi:type IV secretory pathway VirB10-like protein
VRTRRAGPRTDKDSARRWGIAVMAALTCSIAVGLALFDRPAAPATASVRPAEPVAAPTPAAPVPPPDEARLPKTPEEQADEAARAQAAFWVWPMAGAGLETETQFDD